MRLPSLLFIQFHHFFDYFNPLSLPLQLLLVSPELVSHFHAHYLYTCSYWPWTSNLPLVSMPLTESFLFPLALISHRCNGLAMFSYLHFSSLSLYPTHFVVTFASLAWPHTIVITPP